MKIIIKINTKNMKNKIKKVDRNQEVPAKIKNCLWIPAKNE